MKRLNSINLVDISDKWTFPSLKLKCNCLCMPENGADIQDALYDLTGQKTVPNVFIGEYLLYVFKFLYLSDVIS